MKEVPQYLNFINPPNLAPEMPNRIPKILLRQRQIAQNYTVLDLQTFSKLVGLSYGIAKVARKPKSQINNRSKKYPMGVD
jgi:hypothetical protein